jgi:hypothetical protein
VKREPLDLGSHVRIIGDQRSAFDRRDVLRHVERERGQVAKCADLASAPHGADRVRGVLDDRQAVGLRERIQPVHVHRPTRQVNGHDRPRAWGDCCRRLLEVDEAGSRHRLDQHRRGPRVLDCIGGRYERHRGDEHLVARPHTEHLQRQGQRGCARRHAPAVLDAEVVGKQRLEAMDLGPGPHPSRPQRVDDLGDLILADHRLAEH